MLLVSLGIFLLLSTSGCKGLRKTRQDIIYAVEICEFADDVRISTGAVRYLPDLERGRRIAVKRLPILTSNCFRSASIEEPQEGVETRTIRFVLDKHGTYVWLQSCREFHGDKVAVVVDGFYRFSIELPTQLEPPGVLVITGPWQPQEAENIVLNVETNYRLLHPRVFD